MSGIAALNCYDRTTLGRSPLANAGAKNGGFVKRRRTPRLHSSRSIGRTPRGGGACVLRRVAGALDLNLPLWRTVSGLMRSRISLAATIASKAATSRSLQNSCCRATGWQPYGVGGARVDSHETNCKLEPRFTQTLWNNNCTVLSFPFCVTSKLPFPVMIARQP